MAKTKYMLGEKIYQLRTEKRLSQTELGNLVGVSNKAVSKWETDEENPDISLVPRLAEVLGTTTDELLDCVKSDRPQQDANAEQVVFSKKWKGTSINTPEKYEFISDKKTKKGTPYVHIHFGKTASTAFTAKARGIIAIGSNAKGVVSIGLVSTGVISVGLVSFGLLAFGVLAFGLLAFGAFAFGGVAIGAIAIGVVAIGAVAIGVYAIGALTIGHWVCKP